MSAKDELLARALELPDGDRAEVAYELLRSLDGAADTDTTEAWVREIERRADEVLSGRVESRNARDVLDDLERKYSRRT